MHTQNLGWHPPYYYFTVQNKYKIKYFLKMWNFVHMQGLIIRLKENLCFINKFNFKIYSSQLLYNYHLNTYIMNAHFISNSKLQR